MIKTKYLETLFFPHDEFGLGLWFDVYFSEDHYFYYGDLPEKNNPHRRALLCFDIQFLKWKLVIYFRYKHVGWTYFGRDLKGKYKEKRKRQRRISEKKIL